MCMCTCCVLCAVCARVSVRVCLCVHVYAPNPEQVMWLKLAVEKEQDLVLKEQSKLSLIHI